MSETASGQTVLCTVENGLATIILNRPEKLNALTIPMFRELNAHLDALDLNQVGCVLLTGAGRSFCAGHDLDSLSGGIDPALERFETEVVEKLATLPIPTVAAVRGHCYTGALELVIAADIIIASDTAKFADTHAKWDLVPYWGLTQRLPRRIGEAKAKEMIYASRLYSGEKAAQIGLANFCVPDADLDAEALKFCTETLANSRRSLREIKKLMADTDGMTLAAGIAWELHRHPGHGPDFHARLEAMR